jgi:serine/threonine protein kinase
LPENPSKGDPAWIAMPIAEPATTTISESTPVGDIVEFVASIADSLAAVHARGMSHRDIKPENLFTLNGRPVIGDFGLVDGPDVEPITTVGRAVGSKYYIAPELINDPTSTDGQAADVYSLAKTLWVLLSSQKYPLPGQMRHEESALCVSSFRTGAGLRKLDVLIDQMTSTNEVDRPSMVQVVRELESFSMPNTADTEYPDLAHLARELRNISEPRRRLASEANSRLELLANLRDELSEAQVAVIKYLTDSDVEVHSSFGDFVAAYGVQENLVRGTSINGVGARMGNESDRLEFAGVTNSFFLSSGIGVTDLGRGQIAICAGQLLGPREGASHYQVAETLWFASEVAVLGSSLEQDLINRFLGKLIESMPEALAFLVARLNEYDIR